MSNTSIIQKASAGRLESIDFLRGVAAFAVVVAHAAAYGEYGKVEVPWFLALTALLKEGHLGVPLFFVISGYCIHAKWAHRHARTGTTDFDFTAFWKRRVVRLYPPYFVALCISMSLMVVAFYQGSDIGLLRIYPERELSWLAWDFAAHVLMLHGFHHVFDVGGGNSVYWTLAREEHLYILYFAILLLRRRLSMRAINVLILGVGLASYAVILATARETPYFRVLQTSAIVLWIQWSLGSWSVENQAGIAKLPKLAFNIWLVVPLLVATQLLGGTPLAVIRPLLTGLAFWILVNYCVNRERQSKWPQHWLFKWWARVGVFSYSLYLIHYPVLGIVKKLMGSWARTTSPYVYLSNVVIITVLGYWAGKFFFMLVERRFLRPSSSSS